MLSGLIHRVSSEISAKTGIAFALRTELAVAKNV